MGKYKLAAIVIGVAFFLSCSSITIYHDYYNTTDLTSYKTFDWLSRRHAVVITGAGDSPNKGGLVENILKEAVNEQLISRGFSQSTDNPDILISYSIDAEVLDNKDSPQKAGDQDSKGGYVIDFKDAKTRESLWRAAAFDIEVHNATPEKIKKIIEKTVVKIFKKFPSEPIR